MAKSNFLKVTSPKGEAFYPYLKSPEMYEGNPVGFTIQAAFGKKDTEALIKTLEAELERAKGDPAFKGKTWQKEPAMGYREKPDGTIMFKFKTKHEYERDGETVKRKVPVFDAKGKPDNDVNIGNGSTVKIAFQVVPFWKSARNNGVTLYLDAVQVLELKEYSGGGSAGAYGFCEEEGYEAEPDGSERFTDADCPDDAGDGEF